MNKITFKKKWKNFWANRCRLLGNANLSALVSIDKLIAPPLKIYLYFKKAKDTKLMLTKKKIANPW